MTPRTENPQDALNRWLTAESAARPDDAEAAFDALFASVPRLRPRTGFTERILFAVRVEPKPTTSVVWTWKAATAAALALAAVAAGLLPLVRWLPIDRPTFGAVVRASASVAEWGAEWLNAGVAVWQFLATIGEALNVAVAAPQVMAALMASALVGSLALHQLHHLLAIERRTSI